MFNSYKMAGISFAIICLSFSNGLAQDEQENGNQAAKPEAVSFSKDVAPIIVEKCGNCHVTNARGRYGIASYEALMDSGSITPNDPAASSFIEMIESGEMPKGGLEVSDGELETLKQWITQGATFDGDDAKKLLATAGAAQNSGSRGGNRGRLQVEQNPQPIGEQGVAWYVTWDTALAEAKRSNRPIFFMSAAAQCSGVPGVF